MKRLLFQRILAMVSAILLLVDPCFSGENKYIEDFHITRFKDALLTTALWDTLAAELKLEPFAPTIAGTCNAPGYCVGVAVAGDHAHIAYATVGLVVLEISNPAVPSIVGSYTGVEYVWNIDISGDRE